MNTECVDRKKYGEDLLDCMSDDCRYETTYKETPRDKTSSKEEVAIRLLEIVVKLLKK